jgi:hypothetical protein
MKITSTVFTWILLLMLCITMQIPVMHTAGQALAATLSTPSENRDAFTDNLTTLKYPVMPLSYEQKRAEAELAGLAPLAPVDEQVRQRLTAGDAVAGSSFSLLPRLSYVPAERNQNPNCGNCWVWTGTGVIEIAMQVQKGIKDRFSIQYFNSTYQNGTGSSWACCGGNATAFVTIYDTTLHKKTVPWSLANADFRDGPQHCADSTRVSAASIVTTPYYPISSIGPAQLISTYGVGEETAILNIKNILHQNKAIFFSYGLASTADWVVFQNWWDANPESAIWDQGYSCGKPLIAGSSWHAVLCVGYNDEDPDPAKQYWIILNSWGTNDGNRPNGLFRIPMHYDYDCKDAEGWGNTQWQTIPVTFADNTRSRQIETPAGTLTITAGTGSLATATYIDPSTLPATGLPPGAVLPYGMLTFTDNNLAPGATVTFSLSLPTVPAPGLQLWKYDDGRWIDCTRQLGGLNDGDSIITLTITDGSMGDTDNIINGIIVDPLALLIPAGNTGITSGIGTSSHGSSMTVSPVVQQPIALPNIYVRSAAVADRTATVMAEVVNTGASAGTSRIVLHIDGNPVESKDISLTPGNTTRVNFDVSRLEPGSYTVTVNNTPAGILNISSNILSDTMFIILLAAFLALIGGLFILYFRRQRIV